MGFSVGIRTKSTLNPHSIERALWGIQRESQKDFNRIPCRISTECTLNPHWIEGALWGIKRASQNNFNWIFVWGSAWIKIESPLDRRSFVLGIQRESQKKLNGILCGDPHGIHFESTVNRRSFVRNPKRASKEIQWDSVWGSALNPHWAHTA